MAFSVSSDYASKPDPPGSPTSLVGSWSGASDCGGGSFVVGSFDWGYTDTTTSTGTQHSSAPNGTFAAFISPGLDRNFVWLFRGSDNCAEVDRQGAQLADKSKALAAVMGTPFNDTPGTMTCTVRCNVTPNTVDSSGQATIFYKRAADAGYTQTAVVAGGLTGSVAIQVSNALGGLSVGTTYTYFFRLTRNTSNLGISDSPIGTFTTSSVTLPNPPTGLTADNITQSTVLLQWRDNSSNETGFRVYRCSNNPSCTPSDVVFTSGVGAISYTDSGLVADTVYRYMVTAFNAGGESGPTNVAQISTLPSDPIVASF